MTTILLLIFLSSIVIYLYGKWRDYSVSVGRIQNPEQNPDYKDADGRFEASKFKKWAILLFFGFGAFGLLALLTPQYAPWALLIPSVAYVYLGIEGYCLSKL